MKLSKLKLDSLGYLKFSLAPNHLPPRNWIEEEKWIDLYQWWEEFLLNPTPISNLIETAQLPAMKFNENLIAVRDGSDEEGIWHDDGTRKLALSLSLSLHHQDIRGGKFLLRHKSKNTQTIFPPFSFGEGLLIHTGLNHFEHRVEKVRSGKRVMAIAWAQ